MSHLPILQEFQEVLETIRHARQQLLRMANAELIDVYWRVGHYLSQQSATAQWGESTVKQLAAYLKQQEPDLKGFSAKNLWRMKQFYETTRRIQKSQHC